MRPHPSSRAIRDIVRVVLPPGAGVPADVEGVLRSHGIAVEPAPLPLAQRAGLVYRDGRPVIALNSRRPARSDGERRFLAAREFGRHLLRSRRGGDAVPAPGERAWAEAKEDRAAGRFAVEWLMPAREVRRRFRPFEVSIRTAEAGPQRDATWTAIRELAARFAVTSTAMRLRLEELGLIPWW